jgi:hypothetical protein
METKSKMKNDIRILLMEGITGIVLLLFVLIFRPNEDFTRGLMTGFSGALLFVITLIVIFRIKGTRAFGDMDERERASAGKAASIAVFLCIMALAVFVIIAFSIPSLMFIKPTTIAVFVMIFLGLVYGIGYLVVNRLQ